MKKLLVIPKRESIEEYIKLAEEHELGFEYNDFFAPGLLDDAEALAEAVQFYTDRTLPDYTTMHGAFYDMVPCSVDERIRQVAQLRIQQSLDVARRVGASAVVFHTGYNPGLNTKEYIDGWLKQNISFWANILQENKDLNIYLENMFETSPDLLEALAKTLERYANFGLCLDYSHASLYGGNPSLWAERIGRFIKHIHINDNDGSSDGHLAWGAGVTDREQFYADYAAYMQGATVLVETSSLENAVKSLDRLMKEGFWKN